MKNRLGDLNNHLFAQLERLSDEEISDEEIAREVQRADAMVKISDQIINGASTQLKAARLFADHGEQILPMLPAIGKSNGGDT